MLWLSNNWQWLTGIIIAAIGVYLSYRSYVKSASGVKIKASDNAKVAVVESNDKSSVKIKQ